MKATLEQGFQYRFTLISFLTNPIHTTGAALERWMVDAFDGSVVDLEAETARALMPDSIPITNAVTRIPILDLRLSN